MRLTARIMMSLAPAMLAGMKYFLAPVALAIAILVPVASAGSATQIGLANHTRTPGALNANVSPQNIQSTICVPGYSASVRPSESYTERLKYSQLDGGYNLRGNTSAANYEEDHLIPLEVGGSPTSVKNLWPEPRHITWSAQRKDRLENVMHRLVCSGSVSLVAAQRMFANNWIAGYERYVGR